MLVLLTAAHQWCRVSLCPITGDVHFSHLVKVVSSRLLHCKVLFAIAHLSSDLAAFFLFLSLCPSVPPILLLLLTHGFLLYLMGYNLFPSLFLLSQVVPLRPNQRKLVPLSFWCVLHSSSTSLLSGISCFRLILYFFSPSSEMSHFSKGLWCLLMDNYIQKPRSGDLVSSPHFYWGVFVSRPSLCGHS